MKLTKATVERMKKYSIDYMYSKSDENLRERYALAYPSDSGFRWCLIEGNTNGWVETKVVSSSQIALYFINTV